MENNFIAKDVTQEDIGIIKEYTDKDKLHPDWFPLATYDMVQSGYPRPNHGAMVSDSWGGTDGEGRLLPPTGMWCKVEDVKKYLDSIMSLVAGGKK